MTSASGTSSTLLLWRPPRTSIEVFARAGIDAVRARLEPVADLEGVLHATLHAPPRRSLVPFRNEPVALVTLRGPAHALAVAQVALRTLPGRLEGWSAETSVPVVRADPRPPRATLLTLFRKAQAVDRATFLRRWHDEHTPLTLEVHPVVGYVRHVVGGLVEPGSPSWDGIVTEDFAAPEDLATLRLFGRGPRALWNAVRVARHVPTFLDLRTLETYFVEERGLR